MEKKVCPQCQAKLKNHERCNNRASRVMVGHRLTPVFLCGIHSKNNEIPAYTAKETTRVDLLPDALLVAFLEIARQCEADLGDEAYYAQRRYQAAKMLTQGTNEVVKLRQQQKSLDSQQQKSLDSLGQSRNENSA